MYEHVYVVTRERVYGDNSHIIGVYRTRSAAEAAAVSVAAYDWAESGDDDERPAEIAPIPVETTEHSIVPAPYGEYIAIKPVEFGP